MSSVSNRRPPLHVAALLTLLAGIAVSPVQAQHHAAASMASGSLSPPKAQIGPQPGPAHAPASATNPYAGNQQAALEGRQLFVAMNCSGCHGGHAGGGMGPSLRDAVWRYGNEAGQIFDSIAQGRSYGMPAWGLQLPEETIWKLVTYIETLGTPEEARPPR